ncbi:MAG: hypothetical protein ABW133_18340 [Polyangiaceae bacterium]
MTLASAIAGCGDADEGMGNVSFSTWGEEYIEQEIPAADVEDAWTIHYEKFLVNLGHIVLADEGGKVAEMAGTKIFDHTKAGTKPVIAFDGLPARALTHVSYEILPANDASEAVDMGDVDKALMVSNGYSIYVEATATKGSESKKYKWGFKTATLYDRCKGELGGKETDGVVVTNGGTDQPELTIHGDHLYYDDLQAKEAKVRFDNIAAADADRDNVITMEELIKVKLAAIPAANGPYGTGSAAGINDLGAFVTALSRTVGHFRGEGECFASAK